LDRAAGLPPRQTLSQRRRGVRALQERPQYLYHFVLHAALDAVDEAQWATGSMHLGVVDRFNNLQVSAFAAAGGARLLLLHDGRSDDAVKAFFRDVYELYLRAALNPFFLPTAKIASPTFGPKVRQLARVYFGR
jgi:hypothetical protein